VLEKQFNRRYQGAPVTAQAISGWLTGRHMPKQDKIRVLAGILGIDPHELLLGKGAATRAEQPQGAWQAAGRANARSSKLFSRLRRSGASWSANWWPSWAGRRARRIECGPEQGWYNQCYTRLVKTAISLPDPVFKSAEQLAQRLRMSRSELYAKAVKAFLEEHRDDLITSRLNDVYGPEAECSSLDPGVAFLQHRSLSREKW